MLTRLRDRIGTAGLIVAVIALVAAMAGGAIAASGGLTSKQKKEVKKIAKAEAKKVVPAAGPQGPAGPAGPNGKDGANGANGKDGTNGTNGTNGVSPVGTAFAGAKVGSGCTEGGVEFKGANTTFACNGVKGATGFTETLPSGKTEFGTWSFGTEAEGPLAWAPLSFTIPLEDAPELIFNKEGQSEPISCPGTAEEPEAAPGKLCVYTFLEENATLSSNPNYTKVLNGGALLGFGTETGSFAFGSWAVTAAE